MTCVVMCLCTFEQLTVISRVTELKIKVQEVFLNTVLAAGYLELEIINCVNIMHKRHVFVKREQKCAEEEWKKCYPFNMSTLYEDCSESNDHVKESHRIRGGC